MLLALWVGFIPFVGPYFDYQLGSADAWNMTNDHFWLSVLPAVAIFVGGWLLARAHGRSAGSLGGLLAITGSFWLVIGPNFAQLWKDGEIGHTPAFGGTGLQVAEWLGLHYAAGALGILLSAYAMGYLAGLPILARRIGERDRAVGHRHTAATAAGGAAAGAAATHAYDRHEEKKRERETGERVGPDGRPVDRERITDGDRTAATHDDGDRTVAHERDGEEEPRRRRFLRNPLTRT